MRGGVCKLLGSLAISRIALTPGQVQTYHKSFEEILRHPKETIQLEAKEALREFSKFYHPGNSKEANELVRALLKSAVEDELTIVTRGCTMAVGSLCKKVIEENVLPSFDM